MVGRIVVVVPGLTVHPLLWHCVRPVLNTKDQRRGQHHEAGCNSHHSSQLPDHGKISSSANTKNNVCSINQTRKRHTRSSEIAIINPTQVRPPDLLDVVVHEARGDALALLLRDARLREAPLAIDVLDGPDGQRRPAVLGALAELGDDLADAGVGQPLVQPLVLDVADGRPVDLCVERAERLRDLVAVDAVEEVDVLALEVARRHRLLLVELVDGALARLGGGGAESQVEPDAAGGEDLSGDPAQTLL